MANTSNNKARMVHVSPGIYFKETDLTYAAKSLGITSLGLVGETVKGPAFQPFDIEDFAQFQTYFGGTNTECFRGSQYPKYELPYIAKEYLKESNRLSVCRVLGLSGTNAGTAWIIPAYGTAETTPYPSDKPMIVAVLRSRGEHKEAAFVEKAKPSEGICEDQYEYDKIQYYAKSVKLIPSANLNAGDTCNPGFSQTQGSFTINANNMGRFTVQVTTYTGEVKNYAVSLNPEDRNYILNVLGADPENGGTEVYVEELYDVALRQQIEIGQLNYIGLPGEDNDNLITVSEVKILPAHAPVNGIMYKDESTLTRRNVGQRYLFTQDSLNNETGKALTVHVKTVDENGLVTWTPKPGEVGHIYTVVGYTKTDGTREYYYGEVADTFVTEGEEGVFVINVEKIDATREFKNSVGSVATIGDDPDDFTIFDNAVECLADGFFYIFTTEETKGEDGNTREIKKVLPVTIDWHNYKDAYRYAVTPWVVSEMKGSAEHVELHKLFRFATISDGAMANTEVKISIENIDPEAGTFDVLVRSFYDTDASPIVLERYKQCNLVPGSDRYIALLIGSTNESYNTKSNYITVEVNEDDITRVSIPAGFLGYPVRDVEGGTSIYKKGTPPKLSRPYFKYNTSVDQDIRINRQYFGISDMTGIDTDILRYKGVEAYNEIPTGLSPCFHLDARIFNGKPKNKEGVVEYKPDGGGATLTQTVSVDGQTGYEWVTVGINEMTDKQIEPRIGDYATMMGTIYEDKRYRKFSMVFYGGWDGWDYYRTSRSIGDNFKFQKYRGKVNQTSGHGANFSMLREPELYGFDAADKCINSDFYAYLSAIRKFANPNETEINVLATPGIDYVNNQMLVEEVIDMVENERADCVYVVTTPDKPFGASDAQSEMYTASDAVMNLEDTGIDSNYTTSFYPWVKFYDDANNKYIYLPVTKDVVRNFAYTDNVAYPWFAAAGWNRGSINGEYPKRKLTVAETDILYAGRLNYINCFATEGMRLWGDKNFQVNESQMNRTSKRRLLIRIRKLLSIACIGLVFDPNDNSLADSFRSAVKTVLDDIVNKRGIADYRIKVDDSAEARERLEVPGTLYIKPVPNAEYININMVITPYGASFDNI